MSDDLISRLSELRCQYNCFDENERDAYHTLSEAIKAISAQSGRCEDCENFSKTRLLIPQPEIIRCKDCKYWREDHTCKEHSLVSPMLANDFCSRAERRTDE